MIGSRVFFAAGEGVRGHCRVRCAGADQRGVRILISPDRRHEPASAIALRLHLNGRLRVIGVRLPDLNTAA